MYRYYRTSRRNLRGGTYVFINLTSRHAYIQTESRRLPVLWPCTNHVSINLTSRSFQKQMFELARARKLVPGKLKRWPSLEITTGHNRSEHFRSSIEITGTMVSCPAPISAGSVAKKTPTIAKVQCPSKRMTAAKHIVIKPSDYVMSAFKANGTDIETVKKSALKGFSEPTEEMLESYTSELLATVRKNDMETLRKLHSQGKLVNSSNKFGESLLHLSCRRSFTEMTKFLIEEVKVDINIRDDYFRTPLHDACWTPEPNFELVEMLIRLAPEQLLLADVRGFTPFDYVRADHWKQWLRFLWERRNLLRPNADFDATKSIIG